MKMPKGFKETQEFGEFIPLPPGGYVCKIMGVEKTKSRTDKLMVIVSLDIAEGEYKGYYKNAFKADDRPNKKWGCNVYVIVEDENKNATKGFKTFIMTVERSNKGFDSDAIWNDEFATYFKNKLVGGVFGREEYLNYENKKRMSTKCLYFADVEKIKKGVPVPEDKLLPEKPTFDFDSFETVNNDDDLPF